MRKSWQLKRGSPIYVQRGQHGLTVISLVPEVAERFLGGTCSEVVPRAIFVIDEHGVARLKMPRHGWQPLVATGLCALLSVLPYYLISGRWKKHGRIYAGK